MIRARWLAALWLVGCGAPAEILEEDFASAGADVICDRLRECARGEFEALYFGTADCIAAHERTLRILVEANDKLDCVYDSEEAARAYVEISEMSCEDFHEGGATEASEDVWSDCTPFDRDR